MLITILDSLDIMGIILLLLTLVPIVRLMRELPNGTMKKRWRVLIALILFFIGTYLYVAVEYRIESVSISREVVCTLLFFGAMFVFLVSTLSLRTALDIKRIYTLEIENITDPLMEISNRRYLDKRLHEEFSKARRHDLPLSVLMLDIDHFKNVNDTYGHDAGDLVLQNLGALITKTIRESDCVSRYGGEEIVIIFPMTDGENAVQMAERLRKEIENSVMVPADMEKEGREIRITVSIGIAENKSDVSNAEDLVKLADTAMYRAKHEGRNRVVLCDGSSPDNIVYKNG